jgi:ParB-like chromosome segregation protein Spo0J
VPSSETARRVSPSIPSPVAIPVESFVNGAPWRRRLNRSHVVALAETPDAWPAIVVTQDLAIVDGAHRVAAAKELGLQHLQAVVFVGTADDAFVEFLRLNAAHGLPLTLTERRDGVRRLLERDGRRSDRWIAELCGVSPKTAGRIRQELNSNSNDERDSSDVVRVGRDGRARPVRPNAIRGRIAEELERRPDASLRSIARTVGASPQTVRSVARNLRGDEPAAEPSAPIPIAGFVRMLDRTGPGAPARSAVREDPAFRGEEDTATFATLFDSTAVDRGALLRHVECIPVSRIYEVADEARRRADSWREFAELLESRVRRRA